MSAACLLASVEVRALEDVPIIGGQSDLARWKAACRSAIARRARYPGELRGAEGGAPSGTVTVRMRINRQGGILDATVQSSSGVPALDEAALRAVRAADPLPAPPWEIGAPEPTLAVPLVFRAP